MVVVQRPSRIVPRKERFEEVYPEDSDDEISGIDSDDDFGVDKLDLEEARRKLRVAQAALANFKDEKSSSTMELQFLDEYGMKSEDVELTIMKHFLGFYRRRRAELSDIRQQASADITDSEEQVKELERKVCHLRNAHEKAKMAASKETRKSHEKRVREKNGKRDKDYKRGKNGRNSGRMKFFRLSYILMVFPILLPTPAEETPSSGSKCKWTSIFRRLFPSPSPTLCPSRPGHHVMN